MPYDIVRSDETFYVNDAGHIGRPKIGMAPSGQWKALALVRRHGWGIAEVIPFDQWPAKLEGLQWRYKNGKPRYTLRDLDHGTTREWGNPVLSVYVRREARLQK